MPFVLLHMVLLMHSAVVKTPKTQPFHATLACKRHVACLVGDANASELSAVSKALVDILTLHHCSCLDAKVGFEKCKIAL